MPAQSRIMLRNFSIFLWSSIEGNYLEDNLQEWIGWSSLPTDAGVWYHLFSGTLYWICILAKWFFLHCWRGYWLPCEWKGLSEFKPAGCHWRWLLRIQARHPRLTQARQPPLIPACRPNATLIKGGGWKEKDSTPPSSSVQSSLSAGSSPLPESSAGSSPWPESSAGSSLWGRSCTFYSRASSSACST